MKRHPATMVKFSFKLVVLIVSSLGFAAFLSWSTEYGSPYINPQEPFKKTGRIDGGKRDTQNQSSDEVVNLNPKLTWQVDKQTQDNNNLPQAEESQESFNHRADLNNNEAPQLHEISAGDDESSSAKEETKVDSPQGTDAAIKEENTEHHERIKTFFSTLQTGFSELKLEGDNEVPTKEFLIACHDLTPFLDKFGKTTLNIAHEDLSQNAKKIYAVYEVDPETSHTLQKLVLHEFENGDFEVDGKGTISLLWLKRGFTFLAEFLHRMADGEEPAAAANTAYDNHLYYHHGYFVRGTFKLALKTLPYRTDFIKKLAVNPEDTADPNFDQIVSEDMANYVKGLEHILQILRDFYTEHGLEN